MYRRVAVTYIAVALTTVAGCSSSSPADTSTNNSGAQLPSAQAVVDAATITPTSVGIEVPLSRKPDQNKLIVGIVASTPTGVLQEQSLQAATAAIGWRYKNITTKPAPEAQQQAFESALSLKPDGIFTAGASRDVLSAQLAQAQQQGVSVVQFASTDSPGGAVISTNIASVPTLEEEGKVTASKAVVASEGKAHVILFQLAGYPILKAYEDSLRTTLANLCSGCTFKVIQQKASDIGTNTPAAVVNTLRANPDTNWVLFSLGSQSTGVPAALKLADLNSGISIGGINPTKANFAAVRDGSETAWVGSPLILGAWAAIHEFAAHFNGDPAVPTPTLPSQVITQSNIAQISFSPEGDYLGLTDYQTAFKRLWQLQP